MSRHIDLPRPAAPTRPRALAATFALLFGCLALSGCSEASDRPTTWRYVYTTIIQPNCTSSNCHTSPAATAGLRFEALESSYNYLTGRICETVDPPDPALDPSHNFVYPFQPESSKLMYLLRGDEVRNMPPDVPLPDVEIEIIEQWILEGAECN